MSMDRIKFLKLTLFMVFLVLIPKMRCQPFLGPPHPPLPLCMSQFALAAHACALVLPRPVPPPSPPLPPPPPSPTSPSNSSGHGHRHRHHRHRQDTPEEQECCRWLREVDDKCVCEMLIHVPYWLLRLSHDYIVTVNESCEVTFQCGGGVPT
ncbi:uncharacterized protein LOC130762535 [Actinidia eriantha]|uniref:uncharacterized protein LOC130762535 n=1 Tax=Actinidia eriantha TaxID=165200 RepID=UPI002590A73F|nr:uncharacterized protein LOC130762535 [Actinidia eriantha]